MLVLQLESGREEAYSEDLIWAVGSAVSRSRYCLPAPFTLHGNLLAKKMEKLAAFLI